MKMVVNQVYKVKIMPNITCVCVIRSWNESKSPNMLIKLNNLFIICQFYSPQYDEKDEFEGKRIWNFVGFKTILASQKIE